MKNKKSKKINKNEIISYKKSKKINHTKYNHYIDEYKLFGGGSGWESRWESFKINKIYNTFYNKKVYYAKLLTYHHKELEKLQIKFINHNIFLKNFMNKKVIKYVIRLFEFLNKTSGQSDITGKYLKRRIKKIKKTRKKLWRHLFGIDTIYKRPTMDMNRDVLKMNCKNKIRAQKNYLECNIKKFRKLEWKMNKRFNKFKFYYEEYQAEFSNKYKKFQTIMKDTGKYKNKLNKKSIKIIEEAEKDLNMIKSTDQRLKKINEKSTMFIKEIEDMFKKEFPHYGFDRFPDFVGLRQRGFFSKKIMGRLMGNAKFKNYKGSKFDKEDFVKFKQIEDKKKLKNLFVNLFELIDIYKKAIKKVNELLVEKQKDKASFDKNRILNIEKEINKLKSQLEGNEAILPNKIYNILLDLIQNNATGFKDLARRDMGQYMSLVFFKKNEIKKIIESGKLDKKYNTYADIFSIKTEIKKESKDKYLKKNRQFKVPVFIEKLISDYMSDQKMSKYVGEKDEIEDIRKFSKSDYIFTRKQLGLDIGQETSNKQFTLSNESFYTIIYLDNINKSEDIISYTLLNQISNIAYLYNIFNQLDFKYFLKVTKNRNVFDTKNEDKIPFITNKMKINFIVGQCELYIDYLKSEFNRRILLSEILNIITDFNQNHDASERINDNITLNELNNKIGFPSKSLLYRSSNNFRNLKLNEFIKIFEEGNENKSPIKLPRKLKAKGGSGPEDKQKFDFDILLFFIYVMEKEKEDDKIDREKLIEQTLNQFIENNEYYKSKILEFKKSYSNLKLHEKNNIIFNDTCFDDYLKTLKEKEEERKELIKKSNEKIAIIEEEQNSEEYNSEDDDDIVYFIVPSEPLKK